MVFRNYRVNLIARVILLSLSLYLFFFVLQNTHYPVTVTVIGALSLVQCGLLVHSIDRNNRMWAHFFAAIRSASFAQSFSFPEGGSFDDLKKEYAQVMDVLKKTSLDREKQSHYMRTVARSIGVGVCVVDQHGDIDFANEACKTLLGTASLRTIRQVEEVSGDLHRAIKGLPNGGKELLRISVDRESLHVIVAVTDFVVLREKYRLVSIQNIRRELEENEMDAWQKLARVLTHEIMNSITPISSLASTATGILARRPTANAARGADGDRSRDVLSALQSIERRSQSLLSFVEKYREFLRVPLPVLRSQPCRDILARVKTLMSGILDEKRIAFRCAVTPQNLELLADSDLIEQVLINVITNSIEALGKTKKPAIEITARVSHNRPVIEIADNGHGIAPDLLDKIFIPFFTTRSEGSGIGLSLCRQIMRLHNGAITVVSAPGQRTVFTLSF